MLSTTVSDSPAMRVAIFIPSYGDGGVERMLVNLAGGLARRGVHVDFLTRSAQAPYLDRLSKEVRLIETGKTGLWSLQPFLRQYLSEARPDFVLCGKDRAGRTALLAKRLWKADFALIMRPGSTVSERLAKRNWFKRWRAYRLIRKTYQPAAAVVGNSEGVVRDVAMISGVPDARMHLIRNPVITPDLFERAAQAPRPDCFGDSAPPVILGVGGLRRQKGFDTLVRAFARVRAARPCRLLILGEGHLRASLTSLAEELGVVGDVLMPGFDPDPYPSVSRASVFVLSSRWEGSPNALTEALALGTPVVSTDCPSGPREVLRGGDVAPLVPVDDVTAMADAIDRVLDAPGDRAMRQAAVNEYTVETCAARYHALFQSLLDARGRGNGH
ncbi:glycosyltransferase [Nitrogeniibacter aestuarii]|uniref:glycosyltransferase n=1 Tax=Nitrogeniibacter aestuarii TaxID=2815343 RepID=UPI001D11C018|nr:glycosyltransferase [Nitrogeniibacter aestuarii]